MNDAGDVAVFEAHRRLMLGLGYRMLGDLARAEELVQEAWLRWSGRDRAREVVDPRAWLVTVVTRLCLSELRSARARREEARGDRLPEPVDTVADRRFDEVSMALLVVLERLSPVERAVLVLHDVLDYGHAEIGALVGRSAATCRKVLERARAHVHASRARADGSPEEHARLVDAFVAAAARGDVAGLVGLLAADAALVTDGGPDGVVAGGFRNLGEPLIGAASVARFVGAVSSRAAPALGIERRELNGRAGVVLTRDGRPFAAISLAVAEGRILRIWFQADPRRLVRLGGGGSVVDRPARTGYQPGRRLAMTDWFQTPIPLDAAAAAVIAHGMRVVARADGVIHDRELTLIASFEAAVPAGADPNARLADDEQRKVYLRSLIMVALADGKLSDAELVAIRELAADQGIDDDRVDAEVLSVKRRFLSVFAGVDVFKDSVVRVARDLGLPDAEVDALSQEA